MVDAFIEMLDYLNETLDFHNEVLDSLNWMPEYYFEAVEAVI